MKLPRKLVGYGLLALVLIVLGSVNFSRTFTTITYGDLELPLKVQVKEVLVYRDGQLLQSTQIGPKGEKLELHIQGDHVDVPWTRYLPFFQFGKITAYTVYDARVLDKSQTMLNTSVEDSTQRYAIVPQFFIGREVRGRLIPAMVKTAEMRAKSR